MGSGCDLEALALELASANAKERWRAAWVLGQEGKAAASHGDALARLCVDDPEASVRWCASEALGRLGPAAGPHAWALARCLSDDDHFVRSSAAQALSRLGTSAADYAIDLEACLADADPLVRCSALESFGRAGRAAVPHFDALVRCLEDDSAEVRRRATWALGRICGTMPQESAARESAMSALKRLAVADVDTLVRTSAAWALARLDPLALAKEGAEEEVADSDAPSSLRAVLPHVETFAKGFEETGLAGSSRQLAQCVFPRDLCGGKWAQDALGFGSSHSRRSKKK